ncbi:epoxide hydrolase [Favolaschia claudopus]|uniref:Epoxide hydrolase n=1 Tax=Favolaschia claudopus TaxID=2862362 RepID=A0AAW0B1R6_9AGAR
MEQSNYKQTKTKRGFNYSYYFSAPTSGKPVLFFAHGFPCTSFLWRRQVAFFKERGYGIIALDNLGYGGSDKPTDPKLYVGRGLAEDVVDLLDAEDIKQVVAVGHDWGAYVVSRMLHYCPQRISAVALLGSGYMPADWSLNPIRQPEVIIQFFGYDVVAYQRFFVHPDAPEIIQKHLDSFISLVFPETPEQWKTSLCAKGATRAWLNDDKIMPLPSYFTQEDNEHIKSSLRSGGVAGPLCCYRALNEDFNIAEDTKLSPEAREFSQPLLFVAFNEDCVGLPTVADGSHSKYAKGPLTRKELPCDHWGILSHGQELNEMLLEWLGSL